MLNNFINQTMDKLKSRFFWTIFSCVLLATFINACKKTEKIEETNSRAVLISEAKEFFTANMLNNDVMKFQSSKALQNLKKTPLWEKATIRKISLGDAVIVPIKYDGRLLLKKGGSNEMLSIEETSYMMIYDDRSGNKQVERVTLMPYEVKGNRSGAFVGIISVEDWEGNFKKGYAVGKGGKSVRVKLSDGANFKQAAYYGDMECWIFMWYSQTYSSGCECWGPITQISSSQFCFSYNGDGNIEEEVDGPPGEEGTSSGDYSPPAPGSVPTPLDSLYKILDPQKTCLSSAQTQILLGVFENYMSGSGSSIWSCVQKATYNKVLAANKKIGFCVQNGINGAIYEPANSVIKWGDDFSLSLDIYFRHEFFHTFQDTHYPGGTAQYNTGPTRLGFPNIEFEAALLIDIMNGSSGAGGLGADIDASTQLEYRNWIKTFTNNDTTFPKQFSDLVDANNVNRYYYFLDKFYQHSKYKNLGTVNNTMQPSALLNIFSTANCN